MRRRKAETTSMAKNIAACLTFDFDAISLWLGGFHATSLSANMVSLLLKHGFLYDSSLMGDDFTPHYMRVGDKAPEDAPYHFGQPVDVVEIPFTWGLDDFPAFEYVTIRGSIQQGLSSPSA